MTSLKWALQAVSLLKEGVLPPTIVDISAQIESLGDAVAFGGSCDLYKGMMRGKGAVAIKRPRVMDVDPVVLRVSPLTHDGT